MTVSRRITGISDDLSKHLIVKLKSRPASFALLVDEATNNFKNPHLIAYARYIDGNTIEEELVCETIWYYNWNYK